MIYKLKKNTTKKTMCSVAYKYFSENPDAVVSIDRKHLIAGEQVFIDKNSLKSVSSSKPIALLDYLWLGIEELQTALNFEEDFDSL